jgi:tetratricopeptide (TPR) repeat protein
MDKMMPRLQYYLHGQSLEIERVLDLYILIIKQVATCEENHNGTWEAMIVLFIRKTIIESKSDIMASSSYIAFYNELRNLYSMLGERFEMDVLECHRLIIKRIDTHLATCQREQCNYYDIGLMYHAMGEYQEASNFFEEEVKRSVDIMSRVRALVKLVYIYSYMGEYDRMISTTARLQNSYPVVATTPSDKLVEASDATLMLIQFYREGELFNEAHNLENLFFNGLVRLKNTARTAFHIKQTTEDQASLLDTACNILNDLCEAGNFTKTIEVCNFFIKLIGTSDSFDGHKAKLHLLVGKAKFHIGQCSDGMDHIERALLMIPQNSSDYKKERMIACWYLIPRITYLDSCYQIKWNTMRAIAVPVSLTVIFGISLVISPFPFPSCLVIYYDEREWNEKPIITLSQLSDSTTLATTSEELSISHSILFSVIQPQVQEILSRVRLALESIGRMFSFLNFAKPLMILHNILWILIVWSKLILVYKFILLIKRYRSLKPRYLIKVVHYCFLDLIVYIKIVVTFLIVLVTTKSYKFTTKIWLRFVLDPRFMYGEDETPHTIFIDSLNTESDDFFLIFSRMSI